MTAIREAERETLISADHEIEEVQRAIEVAVETDAIDGEMIERAMGTTREAARRISDGLGPEVDSEAVAEIRKRLIAILTLRGRDPLDLADEAMIEAEAIRHVVRDLLEEQPAVDPRNSADLLAELEGLLPSLTLRHLSELTGVQPRQMQRMRNGRGTHSRRMELVLRLVSVLRRSWTDAGVLAWFKRKRPELGGRAPIELLDDPAAEPKLNAVVRSGRAQGGA